MKPGTFLNTLAASDMNKWLWITKHVLSIVCSCEHIRGSYLCHTGSRMWDFLQKSVAAHEHSSSPVWNSIGIDNFMCGKKIIQGNTKMMQEK